MIEQDYEIDLVWKTGGKQNLIVVMGRTRVKAHRKTTTDSKNNVNHIWLWRPHRKERKSRNEIFRDSGIVPLVKIQKIPPKSVKKRRKRKRIGFDNVHRLEGGWQRGKVLGRSSILSDSHGGATAECGIATVSILFLFFFFYFWRGLIAEKIRHKSGLPRSVECLNNNSFFCFASQLVP